MSAVRYCLFNKFAATLNIRRHVTLMGDRRGAYRVLVSRPEGKRTLGSPKRRREDNIKIDLQVRGWGSMDWIDLAQDRDRWRALLNAVMNLRVP